MLMSFGMVLMTGRTMLMLISFFHTVKLRELYQITALFLDGTYCIYLLFLINNQKFPVGLFFWGALNIDTKNNALHLCNALLL